MAGDLLGRDSVLDVSRAEVVRDPDDSHGPRLILQPINLIPPLKKANLTVISPDGRHRQFLIVHKIRPRTRFDA